MSRLCIVSLLIYFYAEYIMQNARLDEAKAGIKIAGRNIDKLRYADDTILIAESRGIKEPLDEGERGEWKIWIKTQHSKNEDHGIQSHHLGQIDGETMETMTDFIFLGSKIIEDGDCSYRTKRNLLLGRKLWPT